MIAPPSFRGLAAALALAALAALATCTARADGPKDNRPDDVRPVPPKGIAVPAADAEELRKGLADFRVELRSIAASLKGRTAHLELLPDVEIYEKAVRYALEGNEFFSEKEIATAKRLLEQGAERAKELKAGKPSWTTATGLVVRGYRSKIDGSAQPYGLVVPPSFGSDPQLKRRLDFWWHGRGETLSEVNFIEGRQRDPGTFTPPDAFVLHPYGRYCNANKFAGEIDTLECLEHARKNYAIDETRLCARGFSMGGAACWHFTVHYPTLWAASAPGAGFSETPEFLRVFQSEKVEPTWYEQRLWHMYNATDYALNVFNVPTVAYSGEIDSQKQAADAMAKALLAEGMELTHVIGPKTPHRYEPGAKAEVGRRIDLLMDRFRAEVPSEVSFATWTLRYNRCFWVRVDGLAKHWEPARVVGSYGGAVGFNLTTKNVTRLTLLVPPGEVARTAGPKPTIVVDEQTIEPPLPRSDRSMHYALEKADGKWRKAEPEAAGTLVKRHGLQGPIDDAFMDRFLMVRPTGEPLNDKVGAWAGGEMRHAVEHWRKQFRGDAPVKDDRAVTEDDIAGSNLVLWGDPSSNAVLAKIADKLPIKWTKGGVTVGDKTYEAGTHVPLLIYPNPLNPKKYVVLNSGFTFREYDYLNNARQVSKLPDYAVIDTSTPADARHPGKVVRAGFFGERWELQPDDGQR